jgi:hypothetical protein
MIHGSGGLDARAVTVILAVMLAQPHMLEDGRCDGEVVVEEFQGCRSTGSQPHRDSAASTRRAFAAGQLLTPR